MALWQDTTQASAALNQSLSSLGSAAKSSGQSVSELNRSVINFGNALKTMSLAYVYEGMKNTLKSVAVFTKDHLLSERQSIIEMAKRLDGYKREMLDLETLNESHTEEYDILKQTYELGMAQLEYDKRRLGTAIVFNRIWTELRDKYQLISFSASTFYLALHRTVEDAQQLNESLIQANTSYSERYDLISRIYKVQAGLGASTQSMATSAQALTAYGMEMESSFENNLKFVTMMREGLDVSAEEGAALAVTFERGLKQSARDVGDLIARVAAQTGLAAQKAAQYAVEIGKALRLLGPTNQSMVGVVKAVESVASRVHELGGNSEVVVRMYKQMLGGGAESFMLRGLAQTRVGALGTQAGAEEALEGIARSMRNIVRAAPGTDMYVAQLQMAGEVHQMAAEDVTYYLEAIEALHRPLSEAQTLQKAYNEQTLMVGKAWDQMREALSTLYKRAMMPIIESLAPVIQGFADFIKTVAESKAAVYAAGVAAFVGFGMATSALIRLSAAAVRFAGTSGVGSLIPGFGKLIDFSGKFFGILNYGGASWLTRASSLGRLAGMGGGFMGTTGGLALSGLGALGAVGAGAGVGYVAGSIINGIMPPSWREAIGNTLYKIAYNTDITAKASATSTFTKMTNVKGWDAIERSARAISKLVMGGNVDQAQITQILKKNAGSMGLSLGQVGSQSFVESVATRLRQVNQEAQYVSQLKGQTTVRTADDVRQDKLVETNLKVAEASTTTATNIEAVAKHTDKHTKLLQEQAEARAREEHDMFYYLMGGDSDLTSQKAYNRMREGRWR